MGKIIDKIQTEIVKVGKAEELSDYSSLDNKEKSKKLQTLITYYKDISKNTYGCVNLITTISKTRIFKPINEYDIIGRIKCSEEVMNIIDNEIKIKYLYGNSKE